MKNKKTPIILAIILAVLVCAAVVVLVVKPFSPKQSDNSTTTGNSSESTTTESGISVTVKIISERDNLDFEQTYTTSAATLGDLLVEKDLVTVENSAYGRYITAAKGFSQDASTGHYWMTKENGEYCQNGIDTTPLVDGNTYTLVLEVYTY